MHICARPIVVKYGGNAFSNGGADPVFSELAAMAASGQQVVLVHGGGPDIDAAIAREGIETERVGGLRITTLDVLRIAEAALCGTVNKRIVRGLLELGVAAVGISGQDGGLLRAHPGRPELGCVGTATVVDETVLLALLASKLLPVVAPLAISSHDPSQALNVNADTAAGAIAAALNAELYVNLSNVDYVLSEPGDPHSRITRMTAAQARAFTRSAACADGMLPKVASAIAAVEGGVGRAVVCAARPGSIAAAATGSGTTIYAG